MTTRIRLAAIGIGVVVALGGCSSSGPGAIRSPSTAGRSASSSAPRDAAIGHAGAAAIVRDYERRNDVAVGEALNPPYDVSAWRAVDSGPILAVDAYDTKKAKLTKSTRAKSPTPSRTPEVLRAYGSSTRSSDGQEPWVLVIRHRGATKPGQSQVASAFGYVKGSSGWHLDAAIGGVELQSLPTEGKVVPTLTAGQRQAAADAVPVVVHAVATGSMKHVANPKPLIGFRKAINADGSKGYLVGADCRPWGTTEGTDAEKATVVGTHALRLTRVGELTLAVLNLDCRLDTYAQDGGQVQVPKDLARIEGDDGRAKDSLVRRASLMVLMAIPDSGKPRIIASDGTYLILEHLEKR